MKPEKFEGPKIKHLQKLTRLLQSACHATGCEYTHLCPETCECRRRREFKLDNNTAICWMLATEIGSLTYRFEERQVYLKVEQSVNQFNILTGFHGSSSWNHFLNLIAITLEYTDPFYYKHYDNKVVRLRLRIIEKLIPKLTRTKRWFPKLRWLYFNV